MVVSSDEIEVSTYISNLSLDFGNGNSKFIRLCHTLIILERATILPKKGILPKHFSGIPKF
jgi:hypothetical protein